MESADEQQAVDDGARGAAVTAANRPRLLDLFCGAGGCTAGYQDAGFYVVGVDSEPQPNYCGDAFHQGDALEVLSEWHFGTFDAIHASPPCQLFSALTQMHDRSIHRDLLTPTRELLERTGLPWVIENVPGAPMRPDYKLCGCMFDLPRLRRERWFETSWRGFALTPPHHHVGRAVTVVGHPGGRSSRDGCYMGTSAERSAAMGITWMSQRELSQAIPPRYTEFIGYQLLAHLQRDCPYCAPDETCSIHLGVAS